MRSRKDSTRPGYFYGVRSRSAIFGKFCLNRPSVVLSPAYFLCFCCSIFCSAV
jgi:hypothetical protein